MYLNLIMGPSTPVPDRPPSPHLFSVPQMEKHIYFGAGGLEGEEGLHLGKEWQVSAELRRVW